MFEILMMVTLLVSILSQLLPEEDDNDTETSRRAPVRKNHTWRSRKAPTTNTAQFHRSKSYLSVH